MPAIEPATLNTVVIPLAILGVGVITVIGMILVLRMNAFLALITAAILVSLLSPGEISEKIERVATAFGESAGKIGIVIAAAAIVGKCLMDSGAADRMVRFFLRLLGEKRASIALMGSGFVLSVPVFFDTVFYLLVPLARALGKRTGRDYLKYIVAIAAGGATTHTLVPPTPGPLLVSSTLGVPIGHMILVGALVGIPTAIAGGIIFASVINWLMPIPLRMLESGPEPEALPDDKLPSLFWASLPIVLPVLLIASNTVAETLAKQEQILLAQDRAQVEFRTPDIQKEPGDAANADAQSNEKPATAPAAAVKAEPKTAPAAATPDSGVPPTTMRQIANITNAIGNPNLALLLAAASSMIVLKWQRGLKLSSLEGVVETSLMSGGVIILITAAGGAFGAMLKKAGIGEAIQILFGGDHGVSGYSLLVLGFAIASILKIAQGSSTVAMITASGMVASMIPEQLGFNPVYLATAIGGGSLVGSWMNDSGFWIVSKMSGLTEWETLKSWTPTLAILGTTAMLSSLGLAVIWPYPFGGP